MYIVQFDLIRQFKLALLSKHTNAKIRFSELKIFEYILTSLLQTTIQLYNRYKYR